MLSFTYYSLSLLIFALSPVYGAEQHMSASAPDPLIYFKSNYQEADSHFQEIFQRYKQSNVKAEVFQFLYPQGKIKTYYVPSKTEATEKRQKNLLLIIAGTHGIEAHAGSAVQRYLLDQHDFGDNTSLMMIHGFNLWGFQNSRRVNETNIDLNRAFIIDRNKFRPDDRDYAKLNEFLNPQNPAAPGFFGHSYFIIQSIYHIAKYSIDSLRASILKGQYSFDKGLFFGGKNPVDQELMIQQLIERYVQSFEKVFIVDLHTGYGEKGRLHLLAGHSKDPNSIQLQNIFPANEIDFADKKNFYAVQGELLIYIRHQILQKLPQAEVSGLTFEYGTLDSQKITGSIESLRRMRLENQEFHHGQAGSFNPQVSALFSEMFYPSDTEWRRGILLQTDAQVTHIKNYLK